MKTRGVIALNRAITWWWTIIGGFSLAVVTIIVLANAGEPSTPGRSGLLPNLFHEKSAGYSIRYPVGWIYEKPDGATVIFSGRRDTDDYVTTVSLQNVLTARAGGKHPDVASLVDDLKSQFKNGDQNARFSEEKSIQLSAEDGSATSGASFGAVYRMNGKQYQQWIVVVPHASGEVFHAFFYTSPTDLYARNRKIAADMLATLRLQETIE